jgi:hypothetical protein
LRPPPCLLFNDSTPPASSRATCPPYAAPVDSTNVTAAQATDLANRVGPMTGYLTRLRDRMQKRAWAADDPLYIDVVAAQRTAPVAPRPWEPGAAAGAIDRKFLLPAPRLS